MLKLKSYQESTINSPIKTVPQIDHINLSFGINHGQKPDKLLQQGELKSQRMIRDKMSFQFEQ